MSRDRTDDVGEHRARAAGAVDAERQCEIPTLERLTNRMERQEHGDTARRRGKGEGTRTVGAIHAKNRRIELGGHATLLHPSGAVEAKPENEAFPRRRAQLLGEPHLIRLNIELEDRQRTKVALPDAGPEARLTRRDDLRVHAGYFLEPAPPFGRAQSG